MKNLLFTLLLLGFPFMVSAQTERTIHVAKAGTLKDLIPENEKFQIEKLTLTGEINGTDFGFLREMAGVGIVCRDGNFDKTEGKLKILDLSKAEIVDGGDYYLRLEDVGRVLYLSNKSEFPSFVFYHCNFLTSVSIPNNVTTIGEYAFWGCNGLTSVSIPNSVKTIGDSAFGACSSLTSVTIPNSVTTFNMGAFQFSGLSAITIPNSMKSIDRYVFMGCNGLSSIKVESDNTTYDSRDNCNAIIETSSNTLIAGCKNSIIPNGVTSIGSDAFNGCIGLTSITYPNSLISIGSDAFSGCSGLTSITLPTGLTSIDIDAFSMCAGLTSVTIPNSVTTIKACAFWACRNITNFYCYAEKIPQTDSDIFNDPLYSVPCVSNATLHVPANSISTYRSIEPWCYFKEIVALSNESTDEPQGDGYHFFVVKAKDGTSTTFALADEPKITNNNGELTIQGRNSTFEIKLSDVQSFKFLKQTTGINSIIKDEDVRVTNDCVVFDSLPTGSKVSVYMADGTLIKNFVADGNDSLVIGLSELPKGILVLHSARTNIKVINK